MPKIAVYNQEGAKTGEMELSDVRFGVPVKQSLVHQAAVAQMANARRAIAHTKTRGEVRGGGKKPWRQKGTGRARHGSIRSPIWIGGGVTFGPRSDRNFAQKINRKMRQKALSMVLSDKVAHESLFVLEGFVPKEAKTKAMIGLLGKLPVKKTVLYIIAKPRPELVRMVRNLPNIHVITANTLNVLDALKYQTILFEKDAIPAFESLFRKEA
ncbi:50S ribosomal protein L4 [Patescibacteria group bacterium]|uniref:Large ribosomal subunit protein uL4 n=1 Tax=candidate division WWE3 bacterium TaxID=2053526 RepID=A0A928Y6E9_UNCKA|nr:50S ribosomal protein L4 [candidate division WWE3 bacterium]MCL4732754.1 50S ribosomal protein L4 [Patescibacteria group bacterium]MDL1952928.1 50S ribosomal protein L4 [Candidatus Uhrbacteria bacterium UHB]RIL00648.1 MAG: 50S ribosomal protein L4 [Candidatus Uhrbacteria bacterium]